MIDCHIVKDLIPSYADDVISPETKKDVDAHVEDCTECREVLEQTIAPVEANLEKKIEKEKINFLKKVKKRTWIKIGAVASGLLIVAALFLQFFVRGTLVNSKDIIYDIYQSYDYAVSKNEDGDIYRPLVFAKSGSVTYVPTSVRVSFSLDNNNSLILRTEYVYDTDNNLTQIILKPYQVWRSPLSNETSAEFGIDINLLENDIPSIVIRFADREISVYYLDLIVL